MNDLDKVPQRIKHYLLDYKDRNLEDYQSVFGTTPLNDLSLYDIKRYFAMATAKDLKKIPREVDPNQLSMIDGYG